MRGRGGYIGFNRVPSTSAASGIWSMKEVEEARRADTWPGQLANPRSISGLQLWLDAADASTLYNATTGGSLVAADGGVARWEDKSGNGRHATQGTAANRPLRKTNQQNGLDALLFDGSNDMMSLDNITIPGSHTVFQVFRRATSGTTSILLTSSSSNKPYAFWWFSDNVVYELSTDDVDDFTTHGSASTSTGYFVVAITRTGTSSIATRRNGAALATVTTGEGVTNAASGSWSGIGRPDSSSFHSGNACEIIIYDSALSDTNRGLVETYLMTKWGIT